MKKDLTRLETFDLAVQNHKKNNYQDAINLYNSILDKEPNHFNSIFSLGSLFLQISKFIADINSFLKSAAPPTEPRLRELQQDRATSGPRNGTRSKERQPSDSESEVLAGANGPFADQQR